MKISKQMFPCILMLLISFFGMLTGTAVYNFYITWLSILVLFFALVCYVLKKGSNTIVFAGFLITFFTFLLGRYEIQTLNGKLVPLFEDELFNEECIYVYVSLLSLFLGYVFFKKRSWLTENNHKYGNLINYIKSTKKIGTYSRFLFFVFVAFSIIVNMEIASRTVGNIYSLAATSSRLPFVVQKIAQMSGILFWIYLSTLPDSKKAKLPTLLFAFNSTLTLLSGVRGTAVRDIMAISLYYYYRQRNRVVLEDDSIWITKGMKFASIAVFTIGFVLSILSIFPIATAAISDVNLCFTSTYIDSFISDTIASVYV